MTDPLHPRRLWLYVVVTVASIAWGVYFVYHASRAP